MDKKNFVEKNKTMEDNFFNIFTDEIQKDGKDNFDYHRYEPTPYDTLDQLFKSFQLKESDVFVDFGSGLGRMNFYIDYKFDIKSIGIEANKNYYKRALSNLKKYKKKTKKISFINTKAQDFKVEKDYNIFYFFNPFSITIFRTVINNILASYEEYPREITLILYYPESSFSFYLEKHTSFSFYDSIAACEMINEDRRERFDIYKLNTREKGHI